MKTKILCFLLISIFTSLPIIASADGSVIRISPSPKGDVTWLTENSQQAFINYQNGIEKLIVAIDLEEHDSDAVWIMPIPGKPEDVKIDVTSDLPIFFGDEVISKAKFAFGDGIELSCLLGAVGQLWPMQIIHMYARSNMRFGAGTVSISPNALADLVSIQTHLEKKGMITQVITAKTAQPLYNYLSNKGLKIEQGSIPVLDSYIEKDYVFVVSWISPAIDAEENGGKRGIFVAFPTSEIYYPLLPTSVYGWKEIPITIRILGHVKPRIYQKIEPHAVTQYFTKTSRKRAFSEPSPELLRFYGKNRKAWKGKADYTRIRINAPAMQLEGDLSMKTGRPLRVSLALPIAGNAGIFALFIYLTSTALLSFLAGGIAGMICFRRFREYALIGIANVATLFGFLVAFGLSLRFAKEVQQSRHPRYRFAVLFSVLFAFFIFLFWISSSELLGVKGEVISLFEPRANLASIRTIEESYFAEYGVYVECKPSPPDGGTDAKPDPWVDAGGFDEIGFVPDGRVSCQYAVRVSEDGQSFVATATRDLDEDGEKAVFTVDKKADTYPEIIRTGID